MRRRTLLGGMAGLLAIPSVAGRVRGSDPFRPIGREPIDGTKEVVIDADGSTAYVATTDGFATVDVGDPTDPVVLAERRNLLADRDDGPMESIWDVKVSGDRLLVAGPANPTNGVSGFFLFDVSDPADPAEVAFHETTYPIHNAHLVDDTAYLTAGEPFVAVDVSGDEPREVGRWAVTDAGGDWTDVSAGLRMPHDLWIREDVAYVACWDAGTWIVDVSEPEAPSAAGRVGGLPLDELAGLSSGDASTESTVPPGNHHYVQPSSDGSLLAVGKESWATGDGSGGPSGIDLWDVTDASSPQKLSEIRPPRASDETRSGTWTTSHNFDLDGDRLVSSWYQGGVKIHDVSDPAAPEELAWWRSPDEAAFWAAVHVSAEYFVAASTNYPAPDATEGLFVFPNRPGEQTDPPPLTAIPTGTDQSGPNGSGGPTATDARTTDPGSGERDEGTGSDDSSSNSAATPSTDGQPGFGVLAAFAGTTAGVWWRSRSGSDHDGRG